MTLHVVIPGLSAAAADSAEASRLLPELRRLLDCARGRVDEPDWRAALLRELSPAGGALPAPASVAAMALPPDVPAAAVWFAQPVHQIAGMSRVHLHPQGVLQLRPEECGQIAAAFNRDLGGAGTLHALGDGLLLATSDSANAQCDRTSGEEDPLHWCGRELSPEFPRLPPALRRLAAETEMWLHELPVNVGRTRRGLLPVTRLWLWGGASCLPRNAVAAAPGWAAAGTDPLLHGLAAMGVCHEPRAASGLAQWAPGERGVAVLTVPAEEGQAGLQALDTQWFAPLREALEQCHHEQIVLRLGASRWQLRRPGWLRRWRRALGAGSTRAAAAR